jgi:lipid-binding SYLF domain-containing protein
MKVQEVVMARLVRDMIVALVAFLLVIPMAAAQSEQPAVPKQDASREVEKVQEATSVFREIMAIPDKAIPRAVLENAVGIAVFPNVIKAAMGFGAEWGYGILSIKDTANGGWSRPAFLKLRAGSWGAQIGGRASDLVLVVLNRRGLDSLMKNEFKIGGEAEAAAGPVGRNAQAGTDILLRAQILSYSRSRGLFAGVSLSGASIYQDSDANLRFYGRRLATEEIVNALPAGSAEAPPVVAEWRNTVDQLVSGAVATSGKKK